MTTARAVGALAAAALALGPAAVFADSVPNPQSLRSVLAAPTDPSLVEADVGASQTLEGPIDIPSLTRYYQSFSQASAWIDAETTVLRQNGFAGGYGRQWYRPGTRESLTELVYVFRSSAGAQAEVDGDKIKDSTQTGFQSFVDCGVAGTAFGMSYQGSGYTEVLCAWVKGNAVYALAWASDTVFRTDQAVAQARLMYDTAPPSLPVPAATPAAAPFNYLRLFVVLAAVEAFALLGLLIALVVAVAFRPRHVAPMPAAPVEVKT